MKKGNVEKEIICSDIREKNDRECDTKENQGMGETD